jgi:glycosyltransferase involved in cell wall biosynthesis
MRVGIAGPIDVNLLKSYLYQDSSVRLPSGLGGTPVSLLVRGLLEYGHEVSVFTLDRSVANHWVVKGPQLTIHFGPYRISKRARDFFWVERKFLADAIRQEQPDIVHAHWTYEFALAALASQVPTLVTVHDWAPTILKLKPDPYRFIRLLMNLYVLAKGKQFSAVSPYIQRSVQALTDTPCELVPNGLDDAFFPNLIRAFPIGEQTIISINNGFGKLKNVVKLIEAFRIISRSVPNARLVLVGSGFEPGGPAERWALAQGLSSNITYVGPQPYADIQALLSSASLLVHPALEESFGMTLVEAMAKATPVIGGKHSGAVPWVLSGGKAGVLVDVTSSEAIARAAIGLLTNEHQWNHYARAGFQHAFDNFRLSHVVEQYLQQYAYVLRMARPSSI